GLRPHETDKTEREGLEGLRKIPRDEQRSARHPFHDQERRAERRRVRLVEIGLRYRIIGGRQGGYRVTLAAPLVVGARTLITTHDESLARGDPGQTRRAVGRRKFENRGLPSAREDPQIAQRNAQVGGEPATYLRGLSHALLLPCGRLARPRHRRLVAALQPFGPLTGSQLILVVVIL